MSIGAVALGVVANAITFVPPNDPVGQVFSSNANDGYTNGRGILFQVTSGETITSVGLYHDLTGIPLSFVLEQVGGGVLRSGGSTVTTSGLDWIDYAVTPVTLVPGLTYHLNFSHSGLGNQNFFYNNQNVPWNQGSYVFLEGTQGGANGGGNFVVAAFRINEAAQAVPDGGTTAALLGLALFGMTRIRRHS